MPRGIYPRKPKQEEANDKPLFNPKAARTLVKHAFQKINGTTHRTHTKGVKIFRVKVTDAARLRLLVASMSDEEFKRIFDRPKLFIRPTTKLCRDLMNSAIEKALTGV